APSPNEGESAPQNSRLSKEYLFIVTALLGMLWNFGSLANFATKEIAVRAPQVIMTTAFIALGFLPAVVVHSVLTSRQIVAEHKKAFWLIIVAYVMSTVAAGMHIYSAAILRQTPSRTALLLLTLSFSVLIIPLIILTRKQPGWSRALSVIA